MITGTTKIKEILETWPESFDVFLANGFSYPSPRAMLEAVGEDTMLQTVTAVRGINLELFLFHLDNTVLAAEAQRRYLLEDFTPGERLDFYGNTICPLKFTFRDALEDLERRYKQAHGAPRRCYLEFGKMTEDTCDECWTDPNPETFPSLMFSKEFNQYLGLDFQKRMEGMFTGDFYGTVNPVLEEAGLRDPQRMYTVYGVMADVFLVDKHRLGDLPVPKTLEDLLNPIYKDNIIIFGKDRQSLSNAVFLYVQKQFGEEGLKKLAHNVKHALHGSVMSKTAGSRRPEGGAIYMVSWFFAQTCVREGVEIIWPEDGAITLPMYLLVRKDRADRVRDIVDYVTGETFANACVRAFTPPMHPGVGPGVPEGGKLQWLGWDYIRQHDIPSMAEAAMDCFQEEWLRLHPGGVMFP